MGLIHGSVLSTDKVFLDPVGKTVGMDQGRFPGGEALGAGRQWGGDCEGILDVGAI